MKPLPGEAGEAIGSGREELGVEGPRVEPGPN